MNQAEKNIESLETTGTVLPEDRLLIVICTYNEIENLPLIYDQLRSEFKDCGILIVDDNSPDGTGEWCDQKTAVDSNFFVLHREEKAGLGSATLAGFQYAIDHQFEFVLTMDGDQSHQPTEAPSVFNSLAESNHVDIGIGSRYVAGGKIFGWPWMRKVMSFCINRFARLMLGIKVRDCSSAFRCYRIRFLRKLDFSQIQGMGYAYLEELLWFAKCFGAKIVEVPIQFHNRIQGKSKINMKEAFRAVWILVKIGFGRVFGKRQQPFDEPKKKAE